MLNNVSTAIILLELRNRVRDQLKDPEPKYDVVLSNTDTERLIQLEGLLKALQVTTPDQEV